MILLKDTGLIHKYVVLEVSLYAKPIHDSGYGPLMLMKLWPK